MRPITRLFIIFAASSVIALTGCEGQKVQKTEAKLTEPKPNNEKVVQEETKQEEEKPAIVNIIDPNTNAIIKTLNPVELGFTSDAEKYKADIASLAKDLARGTNQTPGYDKRMVLDKLDENGQVMKGTPQTILEEDELAEKIIQASVKGGDVKLPLYVTASGYKAEEAAQLGEVVVASYTTSFNSGVAGRSQNIALSAAAINNVIIGTDDSFSFNTTVGPSDAAHGYQPAPEIVDKKLVDGIGGGICQTSSTLFNAVDQLAITYIEWNHHSLHVGYVPTGRDATVSYGGKDFRFKNTSGVPLLLKAIVNKGKITVEVRTASKYQGQLKKR